MDSGLFPSYVQYVYKMGVWKQPSASVSVPGTVWHLTTSEKSQNRIVKCRYALFLHVGFLVWMKRTRSRCLLSWKELKAASTSAPPPNFHPGGLANQRRCQATYATLPIRKAAPDSPSSWRVSKQTWVVVFFFYICEPVCHRCEVWKVKQRVKQVVAAVLETAVELTSEAGVGRRSPAVGSRSVRPSRGSRAQLGLALGGRGPQRWVDAWPRGRVNHHVHGSGPAKVSGAFLLNPKIRGLRSQHCSRPQDAHKSTWRPSIKTFNHDERWATLSPGNISGRDLWLQGPVCEWERVYVYVNACVCVCVCFYDRALSECPVQCTVAPLWKILWLLMRVDQKSLAAWSKRKSLWETRQPWVSTSESVLFVSY